MAEAPTGGSVGGNVEGQVPAPTAGVLSRAPGILLGALVAGVLAGTAAGWAGAGVLGLFACGALLGASWRREHASVRDLAGAGFFFGLGLALGAGGPAVLGLTTSTWDMMGSVVQAYCAGLIALCVVMAVAMSCTGAVFAGRWRWLVRWAILCFGFWVLEGLAFAGWAYWWSVPGWALSSAPWGGLIGLLGVQGGGAGAVVLGAWLFHGRCWWGIRCLIAFGLAAVVAMGEGVRLAPDWVEATLSTVLGRGAELSDRDIGPGRRLRVLLIGEPRGRSAEAQNAEHVGMQLRVYAEHVLSREAAEAMTVGPGEAAVAVVPDGFAATVFVWRGDGEPRIRSKRAWLPGVELPGATLRESPRPLDGWAQPWAGSIRTSACYEQAFAGVYVGAGLGVHSGSMRAFRDGVWRRWQARVDLAAAKARAHESKVWVVRSVIGGASGAISPFGVFHPARDGEVVLDTRWLVDRRSVVEGFWAGAGDGVERLARFLRQRTGVSG